MMRLRPYKACDAQTITQWIRDEYAFRQWSADRYEKYTITPEDMNLYYDRDRNNDRIWGMTAFDETGIVGHFTMRFPDGNSCDEIRLGFVRKYHWAFSKTIMLPSNVMNPVGLKE